MPVTRNRILGGILVAAALALHLLPLWRNLSDPLLTKLGQRERDLPQPLGDAEDHREELIDPEQSRAVAHVASLCELAEGKLGAVWYGGTREGDQDVAIYFSTKTSGDAGHWSPPQTVVTRESASRELQRYVRKVGNAVVFADRHKDERSLWLVYVSVSVGGWSGSSLNVKRSFDEGRTWTPSQRLTLSPFFNISELVKNQPARAVFDGWALPIYHEALGKFPELLWLHETRSGLLATKSRLFGGATAFQPALVSFPSDHAIALCRPAGGLRTMTLSRSTDAGGHWSAPQSTGLPNPNSGLDALRLSDGRLLLAFNDSTKTRENLRLAISSDKGVSWKRVTTVAEEAGGEFSYPFLLQTADGRVHLVYTWQRRGIKHLAFSLAWLNSRDAAATP